jgi:hypothetical protein
MPNRVDSTSERQRSLRISRVVRNRSTEGNRVYYDLDAPGTPATEAIGDRGVPEKVVLVRWRRRTRPGRIYAGVRLQPTIWRALPVALGADVARWRRLTVDEIEQAIAAARGRLSTAGREGKPLRLPAATAVHALITVLGTAILKKLVSRHADPARHAKPGVPDLFLYAMREDGRIESPRFVEVKKPEEKLYPHQAEELAFLTGLGLDARVLRLLDAGRPPARRRATTTSRER